MFFYTSTKKRFDHDKYTLLSCLSNFLYENDIVGEQFLEKVIERQDFINCLSQFSQ